MQYSLIEVFKLTIFSMSTVFLILCGIMGLMMVNTKVFGKKKEPEQSGIPISEHSLITEELSTKELFYADSFAKVAAITALAEASNNQPEKKFQIIDIKRIN
ncbi:hypothetical protein NRIC_05250 [Enterococcus florum]|uniref:Uncharacterized protein n=1 Tax=Enterococcus florum TaxID=2480627 RepID=A0A4P5P8N0_9ENTE|nr:OadG family protein [Enterococcus florum]GCF92634.1 hypothetical protein NRIC_05250 [Enterococcus florum]